MCIISAAGVVVVTMVILCCHCVVIVLSLCYHCVACVREPEIPGDASLTYQVEVVKVEYAPDHTQMPIADRVKLGWVHNHMHRCL